jgi:hypothetical protein
MIEIITNWMRRRSRAEIDLMVIAALAIPLYLFLVWIGAFDLTCQWTRAPESWQLDELISLCPASASPRSSTRHAA